MIINCSNTIKKIKLDNWKKFTHELSDELKKIIDFEFNPKCEISKDFYYLLIDELINDLNELNDLSLLKAMRIIKRNILKNKIVLNNYDLVDILYEALIEVLEVKIIEYEIHNNFLSRIHINKLKMHHLLLIIRHDIAISYDSIDVRFKNGKDLIRLLGENSKRLEFNEKIQIYNNMDLINIGNAFITKTYFFMHNHLKDLLSKKILYIDLDSIIDDKTKVDKFYFKTKKLIENIEYELNVAIHSNNNRDELVYIGLILRSLNKNKVKIGLILNSFDEIYTINDDFLPDFIIVNLDLCVKYVNSYTVFKECAISNLRNLREITRELKIKAFIRSNKLANQNVIEKLIILGYKDFVYNVKHYNEIESSVYNYLSRRGKYSKTKILNKKS